MPRASWKGFLRLSLVSSPIYRSPATTRTKSIRLHQVWQAIRSDEAVEARDRGREQDVPTDRRRGSGLTAHRSAPRAYQMVSSPNHSRRIRSSFFVLECGAIVASPCLMPWAHVPATD